MCLVSLLTRKPKTASTELTFSSTLRRARFTVNCMTTRRIHILGSGALGTLWAYGLRKAEPTLLLRAADAASSGRRCAVRVTKANASDEEARHDFVACEAVDNADTEFKTLIISVKAFSVADAIREVKPRLATDATIILLCNGAMAVSEAIADSVDHPLIATTTHGAWSRARRDVHHAGLGSTWLGCLARGQPISEELALIAGGGTLGAAIVETREQTERRLWLKLAANAVLNPLTAIWDVQNGVVLARPEGVATARAVCDELALLASAMTEGRAPSADELLGFVHACARDNAQNYSSMCMDVRAGRRTEIEELNGWIVRRAAQLGLPVCEANARLSDAVRARMAP